MGYLDGVEVIIRPDSMTYLRYIMYIMYTDVERVDERLSTLVE